MSDMIISDNGVMARAELDTQISTAKAYPRNVKNAMQEATDMVTMDQATAESCFYVLVRNGKEGKSEIKGASIRLAEIAASAWGNFHAATRIIENDGKTITAEACAWDLEKNVKISTQVKRSIQYKNGGTYNADMQAVTGNAASSIALRNAILKVIPRALIDRLYETAMKHAVGDQKSLEARRKALFDRFSKMGIETKTILEYFQKTSIDDFNIEDVTSLIGIGTAIKDGMVSIDNAFAYSDDAPPMNPKDRLESLLKNKSIAFDEKTGELA